MANSFQVGDKVRVKPGCDKSVCSAMHDLQAGRVYTVTGTSRYGSLQLDRKLSPFAVPLSYAYDRFELVPVQADPAHVVGFRILSAGELWGTTYRTEDEAKARAIKLLAHGQSFTLIRLTQVQTFTVNKPAPEALPA